MIHSKRPGQFLSLAVLTGLLFAPATERFDRCAVIDPQGTASHTRDEYLERVRAEFALTDAPRQGGTVTMADRTDIGTLNGFSAGASWPTPHVTRLIFERLATISPIDGAPAPQLADTWEVSADGRTYTFHLSREAKWHDGVDVTAGDVEFSFDVTRSGELGSGGSSALQNQVESYRATDDDTFEITVKEPIVTFLWDVPAAIMIMPRHVWEETPLGEWRDDPGSTGADPARVVGTGPFKFGHRDNGNSVTLVRNDQHYSAVPNIDAFVFRVVENSALDDVLKSGEVDVAEAVHTEDVRDELNDGSLDSRIFHAMRMHYYAYNTAHPPLDDVRVRQALFVGLDRNAIVDELSLGYGDVAIGMHPPMSIAYAPDSIADPYDFDQDRALALLEEAGWSDTNADGLVDKEGRELRLRVVGNKSSGSIERLMAEIERQWSEIGVGVEGMTDPWDVIEEKLRADVRDFDVLVGFTRFTCTANQQALFHSEGTSNVTGWTSDAYDSLDDEQYREFDPGKRREQLIQLSQLAWSELPIGVIEFFDVSVVWNASLHDFNPNDLGGTYWSVPYVWLDDGAG